MEFPPEVYFAAGMALPTETTPIAVQYDLLLVTFTFHRRSGEILDAEANMVCDVTSAYLRQLLVGRCVYTDLEAILARIRADYLGLSRQALLVCMKDAVDKMCERSEYVARQMRLAQRGELENMHNAPLDKGGKSVYYGEEPRILGGWDNTICVVGLSKTGSRNPITRVHQSLFASMIVDRDSGEIRGVEFNTVCRLTNRFLAELLMGKSLLRDVEEMSASVQARYFGDSRRAIITILKDAQNRFYTYRRGVPEGEKSKS